MITTIFVASIVVNFLLITLVCPVYMRPSVMLTESKHIVVDLTRAFTAFTANLSVGGAAEAYYANVNTHLNITKNAAYCSATLLADALLVSIQLSGRHRLTMTDGNVGLPYLYRLGTQLHSCYPSGSSFRS